MKPDHASSDASLVRGYAWHVYPDPATPGVMAGDNPFGQGELPDPEGPVVDPPAGVKDFWAVTRNVPGLLNNPPQRDNQPLGQSYLVLTESTDPPGVGAGWFIESARLESDFQLDQRGGRTVRLVRIIHRAETPSGPLQDCEFQVDRT